MPSCYPYLLDPTRHPDYTRRPFRVPTWETFDGVTQFMTLRSLTQDGWKEDLDRYTEEFKLGRVIWPLIHVLYAPHIDEVIEEIRRRELYLFDLWSYVPGSSMEGIWSNITPPPGMVAHLERVLGDRFLGLDNGEQDGRYIGGYANQQCPSFADRRAQYLNFQQHFERLTGDLGNHMTTLVSLNFGHYFLKEGNHALIGAETAQALPNSQLYYAFIRGAGKQYGVPWFGNASVFNRWGFKSYEGEGSMRDGEGQSAYGPERGSSLSLLKRLLYTHYLYNCVAVGFESGWLKKAPTGTWELTPIGQIQRGAVDFVEGNGQPGVQHTPVALLLDFFSGWAPPRHLYTGSVYQVWGGMPYEAGDYLTHNVLSLLYPGYEDASYFRNERGFLSPTPFGDIADCLLSDAPPWMLRQYGLIIAAGELTHSVELQEKLHAYIAGGGHLLATGANAQYLAAMFFSSWDVLGYQSFPAGTCIQWADGSEDVETAPFTLMQWELPPEAEVLAICEGHPAVIRVRIGKGTFTVILSLFGLNDDPKVRNAIPNTEETPLPCPYRLLTHARLAIIEALSAQQLFSVSDELGLITCHKGPGEYTLGVYNNDLSDKPLRIISCCGTIREIRELPLDQAEKGAPGYWPASYGDNFGGINDARTIAGGDIRIFAVTVDEERVEVLPEVVPPERPRGRLLALRSAESIQRQILLRPTFFQHFEGVKVEWSYLHARDAARLDRERDWLARQQARIAIDFSSGLNFYPALSLLDTYPPQYEKTMAAFAGVFAKMARLGAGDAVISLHRLPENHCSSERGREGFLRGLRELCGMAARNGVTLHLQPHPHKWLGQTADVRSLIDEVGADNLRLALNTCHLALAGETLESAVPLAGDRLGAVLFSAPKYDLYGQGYDAHEPLCRGGWKMPDIALSPDVLQVLDAEYANWDEEYLDRLTVWGKLERSQV